MLRFGGAESHSSSLRVRRSPCGPLLLGVGVRWFTEQSRCATRPLWPEPRSNGSSDRSPLTASQLGVAKSQIKTAAQVCRSVLPIQSVTTQQGYVRAQALRFSQCMRAHGVTDFPDPGSNGVITIPHAMENSSAYLTAFHSCVREYGVPPPPGSAKG